MKETSKHDAYLFICYLFPYQEWYSVEIPDSEFHGFWTIKFIVHGKSIGNRILKIEIVLDTQLCDIIWFAIKQWIWSSEIHWIWNSESGIFIKYHRNFW